MFHQRDAVRDALGDNHPLGTRQKDVLVVQDVVLDTLRHMLVVAVVAHGQLLVLRFLPCLIRRPRGAAADHEDDVAAAPVGEDNPALESWQEPILRSGPEGGASRQLARRERASTLRQCPHRAGLVFRKADLQPGDRLIADSVLRFEPG